MYKPHVMHYRRENRGKSLPFAGYIFHFITSSCNHLIGLPQTGSEIRAAQVNSALSVRWVASR